MHSEFLLLTFSSSRLHTFMGIDPAIGRIDKEFLPQLTLMELLIEKIDNTDRITSNGSSDLCNWRGLRISHNGEVETISWDAFGLSGSLDFRWVPSTVHSFSVENNAMSHIIDLKQVPPNLIFLDLGKNLFEGRIDLEYLPEGLDSFYAFENKLTGSLNLENLPSTMVYLHLDENAFDGTICLTHLPVALKQLYIGHNQLSGSVDLTNLPETLQDFDLQENFFLGETDFSKLPDSLRKFSVSKTHLSGEIRADYGKEFSAENSGVRIIWIE